MIRIVIATVFIHLLIQGFITDAVLSLVDDEILLQAEQQLNQLINKVGGLFS